MNIRRKLRRVLALAALTSCVCAGSLGETLRIYTGPYQWHDGVDAFRQAHPEVTLEATVPCPGQADNWGRELRERYVRLLEACDLETLVQSRYSPSCMQRRDRYMVDRSSLLIAVYNGTPGGTRYTVQYAMSQGIDIVDLSPLEEL